MTKIILNADIKARLNDLSEYAELCDESGTTLGYLLPAQKVPLPMMNASVSSPITDAELDRRREEAGGRSLSEIWTRLGRT